MGYTSQDDLINQITTNGKRTRLEMFKTTAPVHTAGGWHMLAGLGGYPNAATFPGATTGNADLVFQSCWETSGDGVNIIGPQHGGNPGGSATKHALNVGALVVAAAGAPWQLKLVDLQGYYRLSTTNVTGTSSRTLNNGGTFTADSGTDIITYTGDFTTYTKVQFSNSGGALPGGLSAATDYYLVRQSATTAKVAASLSDAIAGSTIDITSNGTGTNTMTIQMRSASGVGCEACFVVQTAPTGGGPNLTASDYTNTAGTSGRAFQGSPSNGAAADAYATRIIHSGNATGRYGPFLPRQGADTGIARINSFTWSGGTAYTGSGVIALCIVKPILDIVVPVTGMYSERDLVNQLMSMPKIDDGACLQWLMFGTGATTTASPVNTTLDIGWGG